jgi:hypothetical protein
MQIVVAEAGTRVDACSESRQSPRYEGAGNEEDRDQVHAGTPR